MLVYEATISGPQNWRLLFLYPPTKKNLLNALKEADFTPGQKTVLQQRLEALPDYQIWAPNEWNDGESFYHDFLRVERLNVRENRTK